MRVLVEWSVQLYLQCLTDAMQPIMAGAESQCIMPTALLYSSGILEAAVLMFQ
jgi:hypothetical protein